ncbi:hypothetical protein CHLV4142_10070 [Campylobacter helveticus]|uniref:Uncharacterized protein n=1 Tax=Campylobacter helveticus TaxID=28898 RepID=A0ABY3L1E0_9BACT|nr:hypothetical protein [Campylobacter helveticus]MCR2040485.1 hypothetical protein [Campylobacter helveticus]MCR2063197.1 hypothetical protein [Campylobacter helveticus]TNH32195.1 hypothetical protein FDW46_09705 [Campylobacter helveticus]TNH33284.1 hypothetical protein FDW45_09575 [Campylobacter helveticus]TXK56953.1 hypothetical protein FVD16_05535 [Campylobacter helveticus]
MIFNYKYSLGIYVNDWGFAMGSEGNPHVFLGLKREKVQCSNMQTKIQENLYQHYLKHNMLEQANQYKINIDKMRCFIDENTLFDLQQELSKKYEYYFDESDEFKAWIDTELDKTKVNDKDFNEILRKEFNDNFTFLRQCYADITEPFFIWVKNIKNIGNDYLKNEMSFDEFENLFNEFVKSSYSNLDSIEGFFGFGPYKTSLFNNYQKNQHNTGGKVFQNNHWNDKFEEKKQNIDSKNKEELKNQSLPRIPRNQDDKDFFMYSPEHHLTTMRPLKTFQKCFSKVIEINQNEYEKIAKQILFHTLLSSNDIRQSSKIFSNQRNIFKDYKVVGNSCVDFVMDKLQLIGASKFDKSVAITPYDIICHIQNMKPNYYNNQKDTYKNPLSKNDAIFLLLYDVELFYQNYSILCSIDPTWDCEQGLKSYSQYCEFLLQSNLLNDTRLNRLTNHISNNQLKAFPRNIEIQAIEDDVAMRLNTHFCIASYFQDRLKYIPNLQTKISLIIYDKKDKQYLKADSQSQFVFDKFIYDKNIPSHNISLWYEQPILFEKNPHPLAIQIQENIFDKYPKYFAQNIIGEQKDYGDYRDFLQQGQTNNV